MLCKLDEKNLTEMHLRICNQLSVHVWESSFVALLQVLVGESIVKQDNPGKGITGLFGKDISV